MTALTERQEHILDLLTADPPLQARDIATRLGISRNAVYQQIAQLKRKGFLDNGYTPSGGTHNTLGPPRTQDIVRRATAHTGGGPAMDVIRDLVSQNGQLIGVIERLAGKR